MSGSGGSTYHHDGQLLLRCVGRGLGGLTLNDPSVGLELFPVVRYESQIDTRLVVQGDRQLMESLVRHATTTAGERESGWVPGSPAPKAPGSVGWTTSIGPKHALSAGTFKFHVSTETRDLSVLNRWVS